MKPIVCSSNPRKTAFPKFLILLAYDALLHTNITNKFSYCRKILAKLMFYTFGL